MAFSMMEEHKLQVLEKIVHREIMGPNNEIVNFDCYITRIVIYTYTYIYSRLALMGQFSLGGCDGLCMCLG